jgi:ketosteroid isomerase-like protein
MTNHRTFARGLVCAAVLASLAACAKPVDVAKETAAIKAEDAALNAAIKAKNADGAVAYDADDIISYGAGAPPITSKAADLAATKSIYADPNYRFSFTADRTDVAASGDLAYQSGSYAETATNPDTSQPENSTGNWVAVFKKSKDDVWKLTAVSATPAPAPAPAPGA